MSHADLVARVEAFLYREARLLDTGRYDEWLDLLDEGVRYWLPARSVMDDRVAQIAGPNGMALFDDDKKFLAARVERLRSDLAHAERPPSRTRRLVSNVEVEPQATGRLRVLSNFLIYLSRLERASTTYVGCREDELVAHDGGFRILSRRIVLDDVLVPRSISIFF